jgi:tetratricopeptide (TPR) repeat protein
MCRIAFDWWEKLRARDSISTVEPLPRLGGHMWKILALALSAVLSAAAVGAAPAKDAQPAPTPAASVTSPADTAGAAVASAAPAPSLAPAPAKPDLNEIAQLAIAASQQTTDTVKWVFGIAGGLLAGAVVFLGLFGFKTMREVKKSVIASAAKQAEAALTQAKEDADKKADGAIATIERKAAEKLDELEKQLQEHMSACNSVSVHSVEAIRHVLVAEQWSDTDPGKLSNLRDALHSALTVQRDSASVKGLERAHAWAFGMEAYVQSSLNNHKEAIVAHLKHMELVGKNTPEKLAGEWSHQFNLACYYSLNGQLAEAVEPLRKAITISDEARIEAWRHKDLKPLLANATEFEKVRDLMGKQPAPPQPATGPAEQENS